MENEISELIKSTLNINCRLDNVAAVFPCATVDIYSEQPILSGDGKVKREMANIQVDLYYLTKEDRDTATTKLKDAINNNYMHPTIHRYYDTTAKKYRATFTFSSLI